MKQQMLEKEVAELKETLARVLATQTYTYYGKDGKPVLARDLEDERDELRQQLADERSGKAWRDANSGRVMERQEKNNG